MSNRLADATSPYLQQHADNPVHWWPWCDAALQQAREQDKPILLSIGYSACHWCHVMAHESFENPQIAELMNQYYINIKVDREERPDLDKIYQTAHQMLTGRPGGWPLTMFLTPQDQLPFFGGTYFPDNPRHGLPGFPQLLRQVQQAFRDKRTQIDAQNQEVRTALQRLQRSRLHGQLPGPELTVATLEQFQEAFDPVHGGFGSAPKFPHPTQLEWMLETARRLPQQGERITRQALFTLKRMATSGLCDQLGGGFYRYSVDDLWMIPHFEKMLYDNALLLRAFAAAWQSDGADEYRRAAEGIVVWLRREMHSPEGLFYSSLDADSEGREGRYYIWTREELRALLDDAEWQLLDALYGFDDKPNFERRWFHLHQRQDLASAAARCELSVGEATTRLAHAHRILFDERQRRSMPHRDDKILSAWNALTISGLLRAADAFGQADWRQLAQHALEQLRRRQWRQGRLYAVLRDERTQLPAYLDDHAYLLDALLLALEAGWENHYLQWAMQLADLLLARFQDPQGGFFFTADDQEQLIYRPKPYADDAIPAGNGIAVRSLLLLGHLLADNRYLNAAQRALEGAASAMRQAPMAHISMLSALESALQPEPLVVIRGAEAELDSWRQAARQSLPNARIFAIGADVDDLHPSLADKVAGDRTLAYVCQGTRCLPPIASPDDFARLRLA